MLGKEFEIKVMNIDIDNFKNAKKYGGRKYQNTNDLLYLN